MLSLGLIQAQENLPEEAIAAYRAADYDQALEILEPLLKDDAEAIDVDVLDLTAAVYQRRGEDHFREGKVTESVADFDAYLKLRPESAPHHWQRGISLYYAGEYQKGVEQFETHQTVNSQDVENAVWHLLCAVRAPGGTLEAAREDFINITHDRRVPMKEVHDLYAGTGTEQQVIDATEGEGNNAEFYRDLYLGLYYEALGNEGKALEYIKSAANNPSAQHYMGDVARTHLIVREGEEEKTQKSE